MTATKHETTTKGKTKPTNQAHDPTPAKGPAEPERAPQPVDRITWISLERIHPNDYNPNRVARTELALLRRSIEADGITQPIVVTPDPNTPGDYIIVDGYHRFWTITNTPSIRAATNGQAPCVILDKPLTDRMASTVRHNRARGRHQLTGMASMIYAMLDAGMPDHDICNELGMEPEELHRLKHVTGFSKLMQDRAYNQEWLTKNQIKARKAYRDAMTEEANASGDEHP